MSGKLLATSVDIIRRVGRALRRLEHAAIGAPVAQDEPPHGKTRADRWVVFELSEDWDEEDDSGTAYLCDKNMGTRDYTADTSKTWTVKDTIGVGFYGSDGDQGFGRIQHDADGTMWIEVWQKGCP